MFSATCVAPINLALVKSWTGERDKDLGLPMSCTMGISLSTVELYSKSSVAASAGFEDNKIWFNSNEVAFEGNERLMRCIEAIQQLAMRHGNSKFPITWKLHIVNQNSFPISARLDTNGARYASIVFALARLYGLPPWEEISIIARMGSGSACRCLYGGFVHWYRGFRDDGLDSIGIPVFPAKHWPNMHVLILVVKSHFMNYNPSTLKITPGFLNDRANHIAPERIKQLIGAIKERNFPLFASLTIRESKWLHGMTTNYYNGYLNDISRSVERFVDAYNKTVKTVRVAYSFDVGPNPFLYVLEEHVAHFMTLFNRTFPYDESESTSYIKGIPINEDPTIKSTFIILQQPRNSIIFIIHDKIGDGPKLILEKNESLIDLNGLPQ